MSLLGGKWELWMQSRLRSCSSFPPLCFAPSPLRSSGLLIRVPSLSVRTGIPPTQNHHRGLQVTSATHPELRPPGVGPGLIQGCCQGSREHLPPCAAARRGGQDLSPMLPAGTQPCLRPPGWEPGERPQLPSAFPSTETKPRRSRPSDPSLAAN